MTRIYSEAAVLDIDLGHVDDTWYLGLDLLNKLCSVAKSRKERN